MTPPRILIVGNDQAAMPDWATAFSRAHWKLMVESGLTNILQRLSDETPDLLVIDVELAEKNILHLIRSIRRETFIPILLLTSISTYDFMLEAYAVGVDDFIQKPIKSPLLRAKFKAWLRHAWGIHIGLLDPLIVGEVKLTPTNRVVVIGVADPVRLTNLEFRLLYYLLGRRNHVVTTEELCRRIWLEQGGGDAAALKNVVYRLRKKVEANPHSPQYLRTVAGVGYEFIVES